MSKLEQVLILEPPNELRFKGPFTEVITSYLKLSNPTDRRVCFKVKTTAPKRYCVRPNSGIVEPKSVVSVAVMLQPFDYDPNEKNKHKFMVQTMFAPDGDINHETLWKDINPDSLMDSKLKCVFELPAEGTTQNNVDVNVGSVEGKTNIIKTDAPLPKSSPKAGGGEGDIKKIAEDNKRLRDEVSALRQENLQLKEEGLRMRRTASMESSAGGGMHAIPPPKSLGANSQGLALAPLTYVAIIVAAIFLGLLLGKFVL